MVTNRRRTVRFLVMVALVCGLISGALAVTQVVPGATGQNGEAYQQDWTFDIREGDNLTVDLSSVALVLRRGGGSQLTARFEGTRVADPQGDLPEISTSYQGGSLTLSEKNNSYVNIINIGPWNTGRLSGTLTIEVPDMELGKVVIEGFSGKMEISGLQAETISLDTSSGTLYADDLQTDGQLSIHSFSGSLTLDNLRADSCVIDSSSGDTTLENSELDKLSLTSFSGRQQLTRVEAKNGLTLDASSGNVTLAQVEAGDSRITTFSGVVKVKESQMDSLAVDVSSGAVEVQLEKMADLTVETFSGNVTLQLPEDSTFDYVIDTFSGRIDLGFEGLSGSSEDHDRTGTVRGGGHKVTVSTSSGSVSIVPFP